MWNATNPGLHGHEGSAQGSAKVLSHRSGNLIFPGIISRNHTCYEIVRFQVQFFIKWFDETCPESCETFHQNLESVNYIKDDKSDVIRKQARLPKSIELIAADIQMSKVRLVPYEWKFFRKKSFEYLNIFLAPAGGWARNASLSSDVFVCWNWRHSGISSRTKAKLYKIKGSFLRSWTQIKF